MKLDRLVSLVNNKTNKDLKLVHCKKIILALYEIMRDELLKGNDFVIPEVGKLKRLVKKKRIGIHPATTNRIIIPETHTIKLSISKILKKEINNGN